MTITSAIPEAECAHGTSPGSCTAGDRMSQSEMFLTAAGAGSNSIKLREILETVKTIDEGDAQSWYTAWKATAALAVALAEDIQDSRCNGGASTSGARLNI